MVNKRTLTSLLSAAAISTAASAVAVSQSDAETASRTTSTSDAGASAGAADAGYIDAGVTVSQGDAGISSTYDAGTASGDDPKKKGRVEAKIEFETGPQDGSLDFSEGEVAEIFKQAAEDERKDREAFDHPQTSVPPTTDPSGRSLDLRVEIPSAEFSLPSTTTSSCFTDARQLINPALEEAYSLFGLSKVRDIEMRHIARPDSLAVEGLAGELRPLFQAKIASRTLIADQGEKLGQFLVAADYCIKNPGAAALPSFDAPVEDAAVPLPDLLEAEGLTEPAPDAGVTISLGDAGTTFRATTISDVGTADAGYADAGVTVSLGDAGIASRTTFTYDAGTADAGYADAGVTVSLGDAGIASRITSTYDAGAADAGYADAGVTVSLGDAGITSRTTSTYDAGTADADYADAGVTVSLGDAGTIPAVVVPATVSEETEVAPEEPALVTKAPEKSAAAVKTEQTEPAPAVVLPATQLLQSTTDPATLPPSTTTPTTDDSCSFTLSDKVYFGFDKSTLNNAMRNYLDDYLATITRFLDSDGGAVIALSAHTDNVGTATYNQDLSEKRAKAVQAYLVANGVPSDKIITNALGENNPARPNDSSYHRAGNRRVIIAGQFPRPCSALESELQCATPSPANADICAALDSKKSEAKAEGASSSAEQPQATAEPTPAEPISVATADPVADRASYKTPDATIAATPVAVPAVAPAPVPAVPSAPPSREDVPAPSAAGSPKPGENPETRLANLEQKVTDLARAVETERSSTKPAAPTSTYGPRLTATVVLTQGVTGELADQTYVTGRVGVDLVKKLTSDKFKQYVDVYVEAGAKVLGQPVVANDQTTQTITDNRYDGSKGETTIVTDTTSTSDPAQYFAGAGFSVEVPVYGHFSVAGSLGVRRYTGNSSEQQTVTPSSVEYDPQGNLIPGLDLKLDPRTTATSRDLSKVVGRISGNVTYSWTNLDLSLEASYSTSTGLEVGPSVKVKF